VKNNNLNVIIKVNNEDLTTIINSLERYNYKVFVSYFNNKKMDSIYEDRYNELLNFLNI
jgi:hypothetical protein